MDAVCNPVYPTTIVCRNSLEEAYEYDRTVSLDDISVELGYSDPSGVFAFISI